MEIAAEGWSAERIVVDARSRCWTPWQMPGVHGAIVSLLFWIVPALTGQRAAAQAGPLTVVTVDRATLAFAHAEPGLVVVLRDADLPDQPLPQGAVAIGPVGADPRTGRGRMVGTDRDGMARFSVPDTGLSTVLAMRIGYQRFQFDVRFQPNCHQTLEIYIGRQIVIFDAPNPRPTVNRAVLTTCSPPM